MHRQASKPPLSRADRQSTASLKATASARIHGHQYHGEYHGRCSAYLYSFSFCLTLGVLASRWWLAGAAALIGWQWYRLDGES